MSRIIIIQGPTASGKSSLALSLAQKINAPIVSADSRQFYKELSIGTAKPSEKELDVAKHYFINSHSINDLTLTSAGYMKAGRSKIKDLFEAGHKNIIVCGGSGMFIDALIDGLHPSPSDPKIRTILHSEWKNKGISPLLKELEDKDEETFRRIDQKNPMRILRSLEIIRASGKTLNEIRTIPKNGIGYPTIRFCISWERNKLYNKIDDRVMAMLEAGLLEEVKKLPLLDNLLLQNTVGYKEWLGYFKKEESLENTILKIQKNSRNYAKRQETWLKRYQDLISLNPKHEIGLLEQLLKHL
jgi:tRNA dimethylallyltransferase